VVQLNYFKMNTEEIIYAPFNKEEFNNLIKVVSEVTNFIPKHHMNIIWESYKSITKSKEPTPCACKSSARLWGNAFRIVKEFVDERK
tara:strand:+ start:1479 stop:1739 length:261 start_codon:yes stop_codon:yes gene_type:complete